MKIESVFVGVPNKVTFRGAEVETAIFKQPVAGPVKVRKMNLDGDRQADLSVHGGEFKAVYSYAVEHHGFWKSKLQRDLEPSQFGENLVTSGLDESGVAVGDTFRFGTAVLEAVQPRLPCYKLGVRFGDPGILSVFVKAARWGVYYRVVEEGVLAASDEIVSIDRTAAGLTVYDVARAYVSGRKDRELLQRLADSPALPPDWRDWARELLGTA